MLLRLWRSTFGVVAVVALVFATATLAISVIAYEVTHEALEQQLDHRAAVETRALLEEASEAGPAGVAAAIRARTAARSTGSLEYLLFDPAGRTLAASMTPATPVRPGYEEFFRFSRPGYRGEGQALTTPLPGGGQLVVVADRHELYEIDRTLFGLFAAALVVMLAIGVGAALLIAWLTRRRLARIDSTALAIIEGDFSRRVPRDGSGSEFDRLAATLNRMLDRISALMDNLRQVSSDVAHDLRTPLTRLHNQLDRAAAGETNAAVAAQAQAAELLEIFAAVLRIAEIEGLAERRRPTPFNVSDLLEEMVETYRPDVEAAGLTLAYEPRPDLIVSGDRRLVAQAVSNLIENALRHTPSGTAILVTVIHSGRTIAIDVADDGPGVDEADAPRLFQRFARTEASRTTPGHGLGLALVRAVGVAHGGTAELVAGLGFKVRLTLAA
jgi:signal transduction histidine kinase